MAELGQVLRVVAHLVDNGLVLVGEPGELPRPLPAHPAVGQLRAQLLVCFLQRTAARLFGYELKCVLEK